MSSNNRKFTRAPIPGTISPAKMIFTKPFYQDAMELEIQNLSAGGMKVKSAEAFPLYYDVGLEFHLPELNTVQGKAKAVRQERQDSCYELGIEFTDLNDSVKNHIDSLAEDYQACENRIQNNEKSVCRDGCKYLPLCQKPQKISF